jgi:anti-sigma-K factor RskA
VTSQLHHDDMLALASLYALGVLVPQEAAAFEAHLREGCPTCQTELDAFAAVVGPLGYAAPSVRPRAEVRERLLSRLQTETIVESSIERSPEVTHIPSAAGSTIIRSTAGAWETVDVDGIL